MLTRRPEQGLRDTTESEIVELDELEHIPRTGDRLLWGGRDYTAIEVSWDLQDNIVTIGAEFQLVTETLLHLQLRLIDTMNIHRSWSNSLVTSLRSSAPW